jgi:hypothetical protein
MSAKTRSQIPSSLEESGEGSPAVIQANRSGGTIPALALLAQLVEHLHGKEGVHGSSP